MKGWRPKAGVAGTVRGRFRGTTTPEVMSRAAEVIRVGVRRLRRPRLSVAPQTQAAPRGEVGEVARRAATSCRLGKEVKLGSNGRVVESWGAIVGCFWGMGDRRWFRGRRGLTQMGETRENPLHCRRLATAIISGIHASRQKKKVKSDRIYKVDFVEIMYLRC